MEASALISSSVERESSRRDCPSLAVYHCALHPGQGGLGGRGLTLYTLAKVRYVHAGEQPSVAAQLAELAISERTYRTQVAELHRAVAERLEKRLREADRVAWRVLVGEV